MNPEVSGSASAESSSSSSSSSPVSTSDIASEVISSFESGETGANEGTSQNEAPAAAQETQSADEDDFDTQPKEVTDARGKKRENMFPHSRVERMYANREAKRYAALAKELGLTLAEGKKGFALEDIVGGITESRTKYQDYDQRFESYNSVEQVMESNPDQFIRMLAQVNPQAYGRFVEFLDGKVAPAAAAAATQSGDDDPEPQPDYPLRDQNGQIIGYSHSVESQRKRDEWRDRRTEQRLMKQLEERLSPFEKERQQRERQEQERQQFEEIHNQALAKIEKKLETASKWVGFKENEQEIQDYVIKNKVTLEDAYMSVVLPKFQTNEAKIREKVIDEMNRQPKSTSVATNPAAARASQGDKPVDSRAIAEEEIRKAMGR